ncbi:MAG: AraC family transcriptional regulator [Alistipes sp.]
MENENKIAKIPCFTVHDLRVMSGIPEDQLSECLIAHSSTNMDVFNHPCRIDAFIFGVCTEGESIASSNLNEFRLSQNDLFMVSPKTIVQIKSITKFKAHIIAISPVLMSQIHVDIKNITPLFLKFGSHPHLSLSSADCLSLRNFISHIEVELTRPESIFTHDILRGLISTTIYKIGDILHRSFLFSGKENEQGSRAEEYFKQFMQLLNDHYKSERTVGFYAQQMCVSPKYLTTLIKRISGKSVSEWVDNFVTLEAKTLLKYSDMSIQEIAYHLNFPTQSFFGSYFKRNTGFSPSQYKAE